ncbi:MAG: hypothetical protein LBV50_04625 [Novosphingobium sp.]|jgi:DNA-binding transcriptional LysR family regulator|nr:hypothetical protein [Novosphingobium sp.]
MECLIQTLAVAGHPSFRHAASSLGITVFERSTRAVRITGAGQQFVDGVADGVVPIELAAEAVGQIDRTNIL